MQLRPLLYGWLLASASAVCAVEKEWKFDFGSGQVASGFTQVSVESLYTKDKGYGFLSSEKVRSVSQPSQDAMKGDFCTSDEPFFFTVDLPEGNYDVTVLLGDSKGTSETTVKAESRMLMLENVKTAQGAFATHTFTVHTRTPAIAGGEKVKLNTRESGPPPARHWDESLTLEFSGTRPCVAGLIIKRNESAVTVYLAGDSTVVQQQREPWAGWGQMLPRFFQAGAAVSNQAESGLALPSFKGQKRLDKVLSTLQKGDYLFIQFGHNDQKSKKEGSGPFTSYKSDLKYFVEETRKKEGIPVLVTPMERRRFERDGTIKSTLHDYAEAVKQVGREEGVPVIDLNAMSLKLYAALGPNESKRAFVHFPAGTFPGQKDALSDDTHHSVYGAYELARCMVEGIKEQVPELAKHLTTDQSVFAPNRPDPFEAVRIPQSPFTVVEVPFGD